MTRPRLGKAVILTVLTLLAPAGCTEEEGGLGPGTTVEVSNVVDLFRWSLTATVVVSDVTDYTWTTTAPVVDVVQGGGVGEGSATIRIVDAAGAEVYTGSLADAGTFQTAVGVVGEWTITITLSSMSGVTFLTVRAP